VLDNQVLDNQVLDNQVLDNQVLDNQVLDNQVQDNQVQDNQVQDNQVQDNQVQDNQVQVNQVREMANQRLVKDAVPEGRAVRLTRVGGLGMQPRQPSGARCSGPSRIKSTPATLPTLQSSTFAIHLRRAAPMSSMRSAGLPSRRGRSSLVGSRCRKVWAATIHGNGRSTRRPFGVSAFALAGFKAAEMCRPITRAVRQRVAAAGRRATTANSSRHSCRAQASNE